MLFTCGEEGCEKTWEGEEADVRPEMADHFVMDHGYDAQKYGLSIGEPEDDEEEQDNEVGEADTLPEPDDKPFQKDDPEVNYRFATDPLRSCGRCKHFSLPGACELVAGAIRSVDSCSLWSPASNPAVDTSGKLSKPGGAKESIKAFEAAYASDEFKVAEDESVTADQLLRSGWGTRVPRSRGGRASEDEGASLPKMGGKNDADKNYQFNAAESIPRLKSAGWYLADHDKEVSVLRHKSLPGHTLAIHSARGRWEHRDESGTLVARQNLTKLAEYGESAPGLLQTIEALTAFNKEYD